QVLAAPGVTAATVVTREDTPGDLRLAAYAVPAKPGLDPATLRDHLRQHLPDYMVPTTITLLDRIPLLPSGKVDRRALPRPEAAKPATGAARVTPASELEATVLQAMEDVLKLPGLSTTDDFFALGGHSLLAARMVTRLNDTLDLDLPLRVLFEAPTTQRLAQAIAHAQAEGVGRRLKIRHDPDRTAAPLTAQQERIAFLEELHPGRVTYNAPSAHRLRGPMVIETFIAAFRQVVDRQPVMRTRIVRGANGDHHQEVLQTVDVSMPIVDLRSLAADAREAELMRRMQAVVDEPIDIHQAPLWRAGLYILGDDEHAFLFMPHHIIWDGWSFDVLYDEIAAAYSALLDGRPNPLPPLPVSYGDFAEWQSEWMQSESFTRKLSNWNTRLLQAAPPKALGTDHPRSAGMSGTGATEWIGIDREATARLREVALQAGVTLNMLTLALYGLLVADVAESPSIVIATPMRARMVSEVEGVMGFFNNLLPLQVPRHAAQSVGDAARGVKSELLDGMSMQDVPFELLAMEPQMRERSARAGGIYQALFSFQDARDRTRQWGSLSQSSILIFQKGATQDMGMWLMEVPHGLEGGVTYNADIYTEQTAKAFLARYMELVNRLIADPTQTVGALLDSTTSLAAAQLRHLAVGPLAAPVKTATTAAAQRVLSPTEDTLTAVWAELLNLPAAHIGLQDNFFDLGGDSLSAMQVISQMHARIGRRLQARALIFESLEQIARQYDAIEAEPQRNPQVKSGLISRLFGGKRS
ncbi:MAG: condensation domain-containing protein, partial [Thiomonas sp.]